MRCMLSIWGLHESTSMSITERMVEMEVKDVKPRLTVGKSRSSLKVRPGTTEIEVEILLKISDQITALLRPRIEATARGRFNFHASHIKMCVGDREKVIGTFRFDNEGNVIEITQSAQPATFVPDPE
jgi:hypothetical protein